MDNGGTSMNMTQLIAKLIEIGKAARQDAPVVRPLVIEAENFALQLQRDIVALAQENKKLRLSSSRL
jgi:hypothetical protein